MKCVICEHPQRTEIDLALLERSWGEPNSTLQSIVEQYHVPMIALQQHAVLHFTMPTVENPQQASITDKVKLHEADILREAANDYYYTLKNLGQRLNALINGDPLALKLIQAPLVELYLGAGKNIKEIVESLIKIDQAVNGDQNSGTKALSELIGAINGSKNPEL